MLFINNYLHHVSQKLLASITDINKIAAYDYQIFMQAYYLLLDY